MLKTFTGDISNINHTWSKKSIKQMAKEADELTEYLLYYPYLCFLPAILKI